MVYLLGERVRREALQVGRQLVGHWAVRTAGVGGHICLVVLAAGRMHRWMAGFVWGAGECEVGPWGRLRSG